jgi:hypothetical protein
MAVQPLAHCHRLSISSMVAQILEEWLDELRYKPEAKQSGAAVRDVLQVLNLTPDNQDYGWVQYYIGVFSMAAGLQADGLRSEAKGDGDEDALTMACSRLPCGVPIIGAGTNDPEGPSL